MRYYKPLQMSCFSPPVMLATFMIEIGLALYVGWRYTLDAVSKLSIAILFFLAVFQLAEYNICEGSFGVDSLSWARIGYVAITLLPPLGFHLASRIAGRRNRTMLMAAYGSAALFAGFFALTGHGISSSACLGNYVIFQSAPMAIGWNVLLFITRKESLGSSYQSCAQRSGSRLSRVYRAYYGRKYCRPRHNQGHPIDYVRLCCSAGCCAGRGGAA